MLEVPKPQNQIPIPSPRTQLVVPVPKSPQNESSSFVKNFLLVVFLVVPVLGILSGNIFSNMYSPVRQDNLYYQNNYNSYNNRSYSPAMSPEQEQNNFYEEIQSTSELKLGNVLDKRPRIMMWRGKVNQHFNVSLGRWETDPDGVSGANISAISYCKKWYPETVSVRPFEMETISTWKNGGNFGQFETSVISTECVQ
ncbi:MAG: hypothetical protein QG669_137 [Patescibacteria group bacterium]|nr:hypothetical protein [Patescibacteria group bacterium]MDQ5961745.1 hypothetical protein [Patescibacteria group bacterium]